jgi:pimeloyl-ACP methyl ester carboxylesterase
MAGGTLDDAVRARLVTLYYEEAGEGEPPVLLVHGWCCDHGYFAPQFEYFAGRGHSVVAVDLRGHGSSDKPHQHYTMQLFADVLAWMCERLELVKPVVMGYSMGGIVAFDLAARYPDLPSSVVMLDAAVVPPSATRAAIPSLLEELRGPDYRDVLRVYATNSLFIPTDDEQRKERILQSMSSTPQHVVVSAFEGLRDYDPTEAAGKLAVLGIYIAVDELQPRSDMERFQEMFPEVLYGKTVDSGHFCQLEVSEQVNAMIERFLTVTLASSLEQATASTRPLAAHTNTYPGRKRGSPSGSLL